ncbi:ArsR/SmtB family transcription factor [Halobaculum marinum]|uniref:ArsR/SmtB family transcription factor n=1 Tax=Halobaculum marinum TaxID=3031996 RepID=A0ABD5WXD5_9EURY|nr:winged helix-turn-helix domain-containing protein [Halobaculum sp. DT55]
MADIPSSIPGIGGPWSRGDDDADDRDPRVIGVDGDDADAVLAALSSETARAILSTLHESPGPASDVADRVDTSLQNAQYHLKRLREAGVVEVTDTVYSQKGREMDVYAPADGPLVLVAGSESQTSGIRATLSRLLGGVGAVALGAVLVETVLGGPFSPASAFSMGSAGGADAGSVDDGSAGGTNVTAEVGEATATPTPAPTETAADGGGVGIAEATETATEAATPAPTAEPAMTETAAETVYTVATSAEPTVVDQLAASPGFLFLCGGLLALAVVALYARRRGGV